MSRRYARVDAQFDNIENASNAPGARFYGWTPSRRKFRIFLAPAAPCAKRWVAHAHNPITGMVNELHGSSLAHISYLLTSLEPPL